MARRRRTSFARTTGKATLGAGMLLYRLAGAMFEGWFRWSTKDHLGIGRSLDNMPRMGFVDSLRYIALTFLTGLVGALAAGLTAFLLIAYGIPLVIHFLFLM